MQQASYCTRFAEVLQAQKSQSSAEDVIDAEHGLAARWRDATLTEWVRYLREHACTED